MEGSGKGSPSGTSTEAAAPGATKNRGRSEATRARKATRKQGKAEDADTAAAPAAKRKGCTNQEKKKKKQQQQPPPPSSSPVTTIAQAASDKPDAEALYDAVACEDEATALSLIQRGCCNVSGSKYGKTPLMVAAANGMVRVMEALVDNGADMEERNEDGEQALHVAVDNRQEAAALFLIQKWVYRVDLNARNSEGTTPLMHDDRGLHCCSSSG